jgi:LacI family transcriptional regulator, galactose operon repressor
MHDVAALARVSLSTVSRVVNEQGHVRPDLVSRVGEAVELLGYRRDLTASNLRRADRASASVGLIFEDVANPFFSAVHRGVEEVARARGVLTFVGSSDENPEREQELIQGFCGRRVDGLIVAPVAKDHTYLRRDVAAGMGLVFVDRPPESIDADAVLIDNAGAAAEAVDRLVAIGHRRIAFLGDRELIYTARERLRGYRDALARHLIRYDDRLVRMGLVEASVGLEATRELLSLSEPPTALVTGQNLISIGAVHALQKRSRQHEVAMIGIDDVAMADAVEPRITVVAQDPAALGRAAAELLFARLDGEAGPPKRLILPTRLIVRGSGEIPPPD